MTFWKAYANFYVLEKQSYYYADIIHGEFIANNGWDSKYNLVSIWGYEESILKKVWFENEFMPYPTSLCMILSI